MKIFNHLDLDGHLLQLLRTVIDTGSVTGAAQHLGLTQSAVSHQLDRLRAITGDALFVKSGRGIVATSRALALAEQAAEVLRLMAKLRTPEHFEPAQLRTTLTIAANDLQRDVLLPALFERLSAQAPLLQLRVIASDIPSAEMLRDDRCHLVISPRPPDASDIVHRRLFEDDYRVFYDPSQRKPPRSLKSYLSAQHVRVLYAHERQLDIDNWLQAQGIERQTTITVSHFAGVAAFIQGSERITTLPRRLGLGQLRGLAHAATPLATPTMPMYAVWHLRYQHDAMHQWLRAHLWACL
jgi:DNA-binding transcriptional LysR family regulator